MNEEISKSNQLSTKTFIPFIFTILSFISMLFFPLPTIILSGVGIGLAVYYHDNLNIIANGAIIVTYFVNIIINISNLYAQ